MIVERSTPAIPSTNDEKMDFSGGSRCGLVDKAAGRPAPARSDCSLLENTVQIIKARLQSSSLVANTTLGFNTWRPFTGESDRQTLEFEFLEGKKATEAPYACRERCIPAIPFTKVGFVWRSSLWSVSVWQQGLFRMKASRSSRTTYQGSALNELVVNTNSGFKARRLLSSEVTDRLSSSG
jgi:hypothetical protein